jgi:FecR protein
MRIRESLLISSGATRLLTLVVLSLCMLGAAFADEGDPPGRVARLSYVQGSVSLQPAGQQDWTGAEINRPLTTGDKLWSDAEGSRAELDIGGAVIRLGANTGFSFLNLDDNVAQMQVTAGTVIVHVRELLENQSYEVDTPNTALVLDQPGQYRVEVNDAGDSTIVRVADGQAEASAGGQNYPVNNQQVATFTGNNQVEASASTLGAPDGFDDWSLERDRE